MITKFIHGNASVEVQGSHCFQSVIDVEVDEKGDRGIAQLSAYKRAHRLVQYRIQSVINVEVDEKGNRGITQLFAQENEQTHNDSGRESAQTFVGCESCMCHV